MLGNAADVAHHTSGFVAIGCLSTDIPRFPQPLHLCFEMKSAYTLCL